MGKEMRKSGIDILGDVAWGTHFCQFYKTREDLIDILVPYFKAGLENNEFCVWITSEHLDEKEAEKAMRNAVPDFDQYLKKGQIEIVSYTEWYLKDGVFDLQRVLGVWVDKLNQTLTRGYDGIRVTGSTAWIEKKDWKNFTDYEEEIKSVIGKYRMIAICTYSLDKCGAYEIIDVVSNHQFALIRRESRWELIESIERKKAEEAIRESEEKFKNLAEQSPNMIFVNKKGRVVYANKKCEEITGYRREEFYHPDFDFFTLIAPETIHSVKSSFSKHMRGEEVTPYEYVLITKEGEKINAILTTKLIRYEGESAILGIVTDITERKKAEEALKESEERYYRLYNEAPVGYHEIDREGKIVQVNKAEADMLGYTIQEMAGKPVTDFIVPDQQEEAKRAVQEKVEKQRTEDGFERKYVCKDGKIIDVYIKDRLIIDKDGQVTGIRSTIQDVTERKKVEQALQESQARYIKAEQLAYIGHWEHNFVENKAIWSNGTYHIFGVDPDKFQLTYENFLNLVHPNDRKLVKSATYERGLRGRPLDIKYRIIRPDGTERIIYSIGETYFGKDGQPVRLVGTLQDVTELKKAEEVLQMSSKVLENMVEGVNVTDEKGYITMTTPSLDAMFGYEPGELIGKNVAVMNALLREESERLVERVIQDLKTEGSWSGEFKNIRKDGSEFTTHATITGLNLSGKNYWITVQEDITEQKLLEEQLQIRQKMDSLGTLAGGIAHDFNNILAGIMGYIDILSLESDGFTETHKKYLKNAEKGCVRAADLIRQFQTLSKETVSEKTAIDIYETANEVFNVLKETTDRLIEKKLDLKPGEFYVTADASGLNQVLLNLGTNAVQAIEEIGVRPGDYIKITAKKYKSKRRDRTGLPEGEYVHIFFEDSGKGMSGEIRRRAFDPLFTTREKGKRRGQGLGLTMVYNIVTRICNGYIEIESEEGKGTTFHIYLPKAKPEKKVKTKEVTGIEIGKETVLVVDDEETILSLAETILRKYGYDVKTAVDGKQALDIYNEHKDSINVVILDLTMPRMSGKMVLERMLNVNPDVKVIISSGHSNEYAREGILSKAKGYVKKPYKLANLTHMVRTVLDL